VRQKWEQSVTTWKNITNCSLSIFLVTALLYKQETFYSLLTKKSWDTKSRISNAPNRQSSFYQIANLSAFLSELINVRHAQDTQSRLQAKVRYTLRMQMASIVIFTPAGGLDIALTRAISCCFNVSKAAMAAFKAGMATASFSSHSCLIR